MWSATAGLLLLDHVPLARGARILDLGCGTGFPMLELAERSGPGALVCGVDPWIAALARARAKAETWGIAGAVAIAGSGGRLPFREGAFDLAVSNFGVNNFDDPPAVFAECRRVLRPGGRLAFTTNLVGHMAELYAALAGMLRDRGDTAALERLDAHVRHRATVAGLKRLCSGAGLVVERVRRRRLAMRFASGEALFGHHLIRLGFLPAWSSVADDETLRMATAALPAPLSLTLPLAYVEAVRG
ncbi:MAG: class I SAM-dependent methyltransferase [Alphaproteobacteria bacterium]